MKKILLVLLALLLALPACAEDIDLSGLSYAELVTLKDRINLAMWECEEWQEVTVPDGIYQIGKSIPVGHWTITVTAKRGHVWVTYGDELGRNGATVSASSLGLRLYTDIAGPDSIFRGDGESSSLSIVLQDGWYIQIEGGSVVFTPYTGAPDLGFK